MKSLYQMNQETEAKQKKIDEAFANRDLIPIKNIVIENIEYSDFIALERFLKCLNPTRMNAIKAGYSKVISITGLGSGVQFSLL